MFLGMSTLRSVVPISQGSYRVLKTAISHPIWEHFVAVRAKSMTHLHQDAGHMQNALAELICRFAPERVLCAIACSCGELHLLFSSHTIRHRARLPNSWGWLCVLFCSAGLVPKLATRASPHTMWASHPAGWPRRPHCAESNCRFVSRVTFLLFL